MVFITRLDIKKLSRYTSSGTHRAFWSGGGGGRDKTVVGGHNGAGQQASNGD